jgi:hypothetical protein
VLVESIQEIPADEVERSGLRGCVPVVLLAILAPFQSKLDIVSPLELREVGLKTAGFSRAKLAGIVTAALAIDIDGGESRFEP